MVVEDGVTSKLPVVLLSTNTPPQLPVNSCHDAPLPSVPPLTVSVVVAPEQIVPGLAVTDVGAVEFILIVTVALAQLVVLHVPLAYT